MYFRAHGRCNHPADQSLRHKGKRKLAQLAADITTLDSLLFGRPDLYGNHESSILHQEPCADKIEANFPGYPENAASG